MDTNSNYWSITDQAKNWDQQAKTNPMHAIDTSRDNWDFDSFMDTGKRLAQCITDFADNYMPTKLSSLMEFGVGMGRIIKHCRPFWESIHGYDVSGKMLEYAVKNASIQNLKHHLV